MPARGQLTEQAYQTVKQRLLSGVYRAGGRISVEDLVVELGTSRQPIMDALKRLETERYLEIIPQVGVRVIVRERQEMLDFFRMLAATEAVCAALAAERADRNGTEKLIEINEHIGALLTEDVDDRTRALGYRNLNRDFHRQLNVLAQSEVLAPIAAFMWDQSDFFTSSGFDAGILMSRLQAAYEEHNRICAAIAANDPVAARQATEDHLMAFRNNVQAANNAQGG